MGRMDSSAIIVITLAILAGVVLLVAFILYAMNYRQAKTETQQALSDRELLQRMSREPDGFLTPEGLSQTTQLTKTEARMRLQYLAFAGILDGAHNKRMKMHYSLRHPLIERGVPELSPDPFLTVEDLLHIFALYDYRPRDQDLIMSTGLPLALIRREMKYFAAEGIVDLLYASEGYGKQTQHIYVLQEPYRSNPDQFRERASADDLKLRTILRNDNFIV